MSAPCFGVVRKSVELLILTKKVDAKTGVVKLRKKRQGLLIISLFYFLLETKINWGLCLHFLVPWGSISIPRSHVPGKWVSLVPEALPFISHCSQPSDSEEGAEPLFFFLSVFICLFRFKQQQCRPRPRSPGWGGGFTPRCSRASWEIQSLHVS